MSKNALSLVVALFISAGLFAADEKGEKGARAFNPNIDSWMTGTITSLDADGKTFSVRGWKMPFASAHCEMMQEIHNKTKDLPAAEKQAKEQEIRNAWADRLAQVKAEREKGDRKERGEASEFNFSLPTDGKLTVLDGRQVRNLIWLHTDRVAAGKKDTEEATPVTAEGREAAPGDERAAAILSLKDLKVGDRVKVGYDSGVVSNTGYVVVKSDVDAQDVGGEKKSR